MQPKLGQPTNVRVEVKGNIARITFTRGENAKETILGIEGGAVEDRKPTYKTTTGTSFELKGLEYRTLYGFGLRSKNKAEVTDWLQKDNFFFITEEEPKSPNYPKKPINPTINRIESLANSTAKVYISTGDNTERLEIQARLSGSNKWRSLLTSSSSSNKEEVKSIALEEEKTYDIRVRALNSSYSTKSEFVYYYNFTMLIIPTGNVYLQFNDSNDKVKILQRDLKALGYFKYPEITGNYLTITQSAVIDFQRANKFIADGKVYLRTIKKITEKLLESGYAYKEGNQSGKIKDIQAKLHSLGYYDRELNGGYNDATVEAVANFQKSPCFEIIIDFYNKTSRLGVLDPTTIKKIDEEYDSLCLNMSKDEMKELQRKLIIVGQYYKLYPELSETGYYDKKTQSDVRIFRKKFNKPFGKIALDLETKNGIEEKYREITSGPGRKLSIYPRYKYAEIKEGDKGDYVRHLQIDLKEIGEFNKEPNGEYDTYTRLCVREFQRKWLLEIDGIFNENSQGRMIEALRAVSKDGMTETIKEGVYKKYISILANGLSISIGKDEYMEEIIHAIYCLENGVKLSAKVIETIDNLKASNYSGELAYEIAQIINNNSDTFWRKKYSDISLDKEYFGLNLNNFKDLSKLCLIVLNDGHKYIEIERLKAKIREAVHTLNKKPKFYKTQSNSIKSCINSYNNISPENLYMKGLLCSELAEIITYTNTTLGKNMYEISERVGKGLSSAFQIIGGKGEMDLGILMAISAAFATGVIAPVLLFGVGAYMACDGLSNVLDGIEGFSRGITFNEESSGVLNFTKQFHLLFGELYEYNGEKVYNVSQIVINAYDLGRAGRYGIKDYKALSKGDLKHTYVYLEDTISISPRKSQMIKYTKNQHVYDKIVIEKVKDKDGIYKQFIKAIPKKTYKNEGKLTIRKITIDTHKLRNKILNQTGLDIYSITNSSIEVGNDNNTNNGNNYDCNVLNENSNACNTSFQTCGNGMHTTPCVSEYGGGVEM